MTWLRTLCKRLWEESRVWKDEQTWQWHGLRAGLGVLVVGVLLVVVQKVPERQVRWTHLQIPAKNLNELNADVTVKDVADEENEYRKTIIQMVGGGFALLAVYFTWRRVRVAEQGHLTDRYSKAIELLGATDKDGNANVEVRLGAIYALERIAQDSARDQWTIVEVLTAYVRKNAPAPTEATPREEVAKGPATEIQAVLTVLGRRRRGAKREREGQRLDLHGTDLRRANFTGAHVEGANFSESHVGGAGFFQAHVEGANFTKAHVEGAGFFQAHVEGADFVQAHVEGAYFNEAHVEGAYFWGARVEGAIFFQAHVEGAYFNEAHVEGASFWGAHVEGANFNEAHVEGAYFRLAHVEGADFSDAHVEGANFRRANFSEATELRVGQIQRADGWEKAKYDDDFAKELGLVEEAAAGGETE